jgi:hypothetical protein
MKSKKNSSKPEKPEASNPDKSIDPKTQQVIESHKKNIEDINLLALADCLASDLNYLDCNYVNGRIIQTLEEAMAKVDFSEQLSEMAFLDLFKKKTKEIKGLTVVKLEKGDDENRHNRCEPVVVKIIDRMISDELWEKDSDWLKAFIKENNRVFVLSLAKHYLEALFNQMDFSLQQSLKKGDTILWGCDKSQLSLKHLDEVLKIK